ncbi:MAG: hypothetical protein A2Y15_04435 [Clostridiales bacterium GWF2_36_10]|nr:MAG: hypothetical protein A2Y15_04435 [Clostridiales bacterium GWF2_36_10]HAN20659.1 hypothetical protein [Clostridiales bacterium]
MITKIRVLPLWSHFVIDLLCIALFSTSFYYINYRIPRELDGDFIVIPRTTDTTINDNILDNSQNTENLSEWAVKFSDKFTDTVIQTENSYTSPNVSITVTKHTKGSGDSLITYYVADIYITDINCLESGFANHKYGVGYSENLIDMDSNLNAILAINGDYYGNGQSGAVIRNGVVYRKNADNSDVCVLYYDGSIKTFSPDEFNIDQAIKDGAYQAWTFGPVLLDENENCLSDFNSRVTPKNPRSVIGYYEPGHYCFVLVDGRQKGYSCGMKMSELSELMKELGCKAAYNLDGGQSSSMTFNDRIFNQPYDGGRAVSDCIFIKELD